MSFLTQLIAQLADGRFHTGAALGAQCGLGRHQLRQHVGQLAPLGLTLQAVPGRGYRLAQPLELLDHAHIVAALNQNKTNTDPTRLTEIEILPMVDSTNTWLAQRAAAGAPSGSVCVAEWQQAGRGRRGRTWHAPYGSGVCLSLLWRFPQSVDGGLSLAVGVALTRTLAEVGASTGIGLKWPNDIMWQERKLGGILVEMRGESVSGWEVVIGIGLNVHLPLSYAHVIDQPWVDLATLLGRPPARNFLIGRLLYHLAQACHTYSHEGLNAFRAEWQARDILQGRMIHVQQGAHSHVGMACGINDQGALLMMRQGRLEPIWHGDISVRTVTADEQPQHNFGVTE